MGDPSLWVLALVRGGTAARALVGSSLGASTALRVVFHVDLWSDDIGPGLRLPHPFYVVVGGGVSIGRDCTILHGVTIQHGEGTSVGDGALLGVGSTVLAGSRVGARALVGAHSVVRGDVPDAHVVVGAPARVVRAVRDEEVVS
jgi:serine O-acetyltransferase